MKTAAFVLLFLCIFSQCLARTAPDLSSRIRIDGDLSDYEPDEWVLDTTTAFREAPDDSRWGADNDISRMAVTWDQNYLYIGIEATCYSSILMVFLEHAAGGASDLLVAGELRRNVLFSRITPNILVVADRADSEARVAVVSILEAPRYVAQDQYQSRYFQPARGQGALEMALPWDRVLPEAGFIKLLAAVTAGSGTGAGDAAPDPTSLLQFQRQAQAHLDNAITLPVDENNDKEADMGVSPRYVATFEYIQQAPVSSVTDFDIRLINDTAVPDAGESLRFQIDAIGLEQVSQYYMTCDVYSVSGNRVRVLFKDELRLYQPGVPPRVDVWDGRDDSGEIVPGGIYVINLSSGLSPGLVDFFTRKSAAVVR